MFEKLPNPYYKMEQKSNPAKAASSRSRDQEIINAFERLTSDITLMLGKHLSEPHRKYLLFNHYHQVERPTIYVEFICAFCAVSVVLRGGVYIIKLSVTADNLRAGTGVHTNGLLRAAFKRTMEANTQMSIENILEIEIFNQPFEYFKKRSQSSDMSWCVKGQAW